MKKIRVFIVVLILFISFNPTALATTTNNSTNNFIVETTNYKYQILRDGSAKILLYKGKNKNINIPKSIEGHTIRIIGDEALRNYADYLDNDYIIKNLYIPDTVIYIDMYLFEFVKIENINVDNNNKNYSSKNGVLYNKNKTRIIRYGMSRKERIFTIIPSVISICEGCFSDNNYLERVILNKKITIIPDSAFQFCSNLKIIPLSKNIKKIGNLSFCGCTSFHEITIPKNVEVIDRSAFSGCPYLNVVFIENDKIKINDHTFDNAISTNPFATLCDMIFPVYIIGNKGSTSEYYCKNKSYGQTIFVERNDYQKFPFLYSTTFRIICIIGIIVLILAIIVAIVLLPVIISRRKEISNNSKKQFR